MRASADPAVFIKCAISGLMGRIESWEDLWECEVAVEIEEIAESMDDVRGNGRASGRIVEVVKVEAAEESGEGGGEF